MTDADRTDVRVVRTVGNETEIVAPDRGITHEVPAPCAHRYYRRRRGAARSRFTG